MEYSTSFDGWNIRGVQIDEHKRRDGVSYVYVLVGSNDGKRAASIDANGDIEIDTYYNDEYNNGSIPVNVMLIAIEMWKTIMNLPQ
jgi:hypothetical protein